MSVEVSVKVKIKQRQARNTVTNAIARATFCASSRATFWTMLFELRASVARAGSQFKQPCQKRRAGRRASNRVGVFRALVISH